MRSILVLVVFALAIPSLIVYAQTEPKPKPTSSATQQMGLTEQQLARLDRDLMNATVRNDQTLTQRFAVERHVPSVCLAQSANSQADEAGVRKTIGRMRESVEKRDADMRARLFTEEAVFYNAFGLEREGREAIKEFWKYIFASGTFSKSEFKITKEKIRFIRPDIAVVDIFEEVLGQRAPETGRELPPRSVQLTLIMTKKGDDWLIAHYRAGDIRTDSIVR